MFTIVFSIHCNFLILLPFCLVSCRSNGFFLFARQNVRARIIGRVSEVLHDRERPIGIGGPICPGLESNMANILRVSHILQIYFTSI